ncbi:hypothetical protein IWQ61_000022 [Dispira simplex]|nr:hypothetical protein IWQ61_000022 [Dispira simplex]
MFNAYTSSKPLPSPTLTLAGLPEPPMGERFSQMVMYHGHSYTDGFRWMQDDIPMKNPKIMNQLEAENSYTRAVLATHQDIQDDIYQELLHVTGTKGNTPTAESSLAKCELHRIFRGNAPQSPTYMYYWKQSPGDLQKRLYRRRVGRRASEELLLDFNASQHSCRVLHSLEVSPDHRWVAYVLDTTGQGKLSLHCYDTVAKRVSHQDVVHNVAPSVCWGNDSTTLFYCTPTNAKRPGQVYRHTMGRAVHYNSPIIENRDPRTRLQVRKSASGEYIFVDVLESQRSETHFLPANAARTADLVIIQPLEHRLKYYVEHQKDNFIILANREDQDLRINGQIFTCPVAGPAYSRNYWQPLFTNASYTWTEKVLPFANCLVLFERAHGKAHLRVLKPNCSASTDPVTPGSTGVSALYSAPGFTSFYIPISENISSLKVDAGAQSYSENILRYTTSSFCSPSRTFEYDLSCHRCQLFYEAPGRDVFESHLYTQERQFVDIALVKDSLHLNPPRYLRIPVSLVYHTVKFRQDGTNPAVVLLNGCKGECYEPEFDPLWKPLLDRGYVIAIAHVRGGSENGRSWYEVYGKHLQKKGAVYDLLAVINFLTQKKYTSPHKTAVMSFTPGAGMTVAAAMNLKPHMFRAVVLQSPSVDFLNYIMNASTIHPELAEEYGDPTTDTTIFKYIHSYSPYDHIPPMRRLPHVLARANLTDTQSKYWESLKWVNQLRNLKTTGLPGDPDCRDALLAVPIETSAANIPSLSRTLRRTAEDFAFIIERLSASLTRPRTPISGSAGLPRSGKFGRINSHDIDFDVPRASYSSVETRR